MGGLHPRTGFFILLCLVVGQIFSILGTVFLSEWCTCNNRLELRWGLLWVEILGTSHSMDEGILATSKTMGRLSSAGLSITILAVIGMLAGIISCLPAGISAARSGKGSFGAAFGLVALDIAARAAGLCIYIQSVRPSIGKMNVMDALDSFISPYLRSATFSCKENDIGSGIVVSVIEVVVMLAGLIVLCTALDSSRTSRHPDDEARDITMQMHDVRASQDGPPHEIHDNFRESQAEPAYNPQDGAPHQLHDNLRASQAEPPYNPQDGASHQFHDNFQTSQAGDHVSSGVQMLDFQSRPLEARPPGNLQGQIHDFQSWPPQAGPLGNSQGQMYTSQAGPHSYPQDQINDFQSWPQAAPHGSPRGQMHAFQQYPAGAVATFQTPAVNVPVGIHRTVVHTRQQWTQPGSVAGSQGPPLSGMGQSIGASPQQQGMRPFF